MTPAWVHPIGSAQRVTCDTHHQAKRAKDMGKTHTTPTADPKKDERAARLEQALRDNLKRRKTQANERTDRPEGDGARKKPIG